MKKLAAWLGIACLFFCLSFGKKPPRILAGPMLGYVGMREVCIWLQSDQETKLELRYWPKDSLQQQKRAFFSTKAESDFSVKCILTNLEPSTCYEYQVLCNGKSLANGSSGSFCTQVLWQHRSDPPVVRFVFGSCAYVNESAYDRPGKPYGGGYRILEQIAKENSQFMLWGGDNTYLREADWDSRSGIFHRYRHTRQLPELQKLLLSMAHYALWDDHDFGPNDSDGSYVYKNHSEEAFKTYWCNPNWGPGTDGKGVSGVFYWADLRFILLDNRYFRDANGDKNPQKRMMGAQQLAWLRQLLFDHSHSFTFIAMGGQFLNDAAVYENYENYAWEKKELLSILAESACPGLVLLSGDRHHSAVNKLQTKEMPYPLYEITSSPLLSSTHEPKEKNSCLLPETLLVERNYALIEVLGKKKERELRLQFKDSLGNTRVSFSLKQSDLQGGK